jgi:CubicO group peptidase (beta-lactamase class C family)
MLLAAPFIARTANAASFPAPGVWPSGSPASVGLNVTKLMEAQAYAQQYGGGAGCVIRNGLLVHSWGSLSQLYLVQSATKSFGSALLGFAVDDGKIDVAAPAQRYLPGIGAVPSSNTSTGWLDNIRVDHLATHLGGFPKSRLPSALVCQPGTKFLYSDGGTNWLAALLTKVYGQDLRTLAQSRLFTPIGVPGTAAVWSPLGTEYQMPPTCRFNGGMQANVDTMARLGYLYLNNGNWDGRQIISSAYVKLSTGAYLPAPAGLLPQELRPAVVGGHGRQGAVLPLERPLQQPHLRLPGPGHGRGPGRHRRLGPARWVDQRLPAADRGGRAVASHACSHVVWWLASCSETSRVVAFDRFVASHCLLGCIPVYRPRLVGHRIGA